MALGSKKAKETPAAPFEDEVTLWAKAVVKGKIVAGPHVRNAAARHLDDLKNGHKRGLKWDTDAVERVFKFFRHVLCLSKGKFEGKPFELEPSQKFLIGSLFGWKKVDGKRRFRRAYIEQGKGNGKALALDTPIPTPSGWTTMGAIQPGDFVFDEAGRPTRVNAVSGVMLGRPCYCVKFSDGAEITADAGHLWAVSPLRTGGIRGSKTNKFKKGEKAIHTTEYISETYRLPTSKSAHPQAKWNYRVEVSGPLDLPEVVLPLPPYSFGYWLGNGDSDCGRVTCAIGDEEVLNYLAEEGTPIGLKRRDKGALRVALSNGEKDQASRNLSFGARLRLMRVLNNKHIPTHYLRASQGQRLALLRGLLDSDGYVSDSGQIELTLTNERLADGAIELVRSLGFKTVKRKSDAMLNGRKVSDRYRITFTPPSDFKMFNLERKQSKLKPAPKTRRLGAGRMIVACELVPSVPVQCISVDSPSHLFLAGEHFVPTHNSPIAAGIGMYCLLADGEPGAEVYAAASKKDQAQVMYQSAVSMRKHSPALASRLVTSGANPVWNMAHLDSGSFFRPISSESGQSGPLPSCALCDEIHEHKDGMVLEMLERGFKSRRQPLLIMITNSGSDRNSVCWEEHVNAIRAAAGNAELYGKVDEDWRYVGNAAAAAQFDDTFSFVCSLDHGDDPLEDEKCWIKANPLLDVTIPSEELRRAVRQAKSMPGKLNNVLRLHFCVWTDSDSAWMSRATLEQCVEDFHPSELIGEKVYAGIDLSGSRDLTALALIVPTGLVESKRENGGTQLLPTFDAWVEAWTPGDGLRERALRDNAPYDVWAEQGWLNAPPGPQVRMDFVAARLAEISTEYQLEGVAYDRYAYRKFEEELDALGVTVPQFEHPQGGKRRARPPDAIVENARRNGEEPPEGLWMPGSLKMLETLLIERRIRIRRNPVLISAAMSAAIESDPFDNRWFSKRKATNRIDAIVALAMAVGLATSSPGEIVRGSVYNTGRDLLVL